MHACRCHVCPVYFLFMYNSLLFSVARTFTFSPIIIIIIIQTHRSIPRHDYSNLFSYNIICICFCLYIAKWQVMCIFKELQNDQESKDGAINEEQFYRLYVVKDVRWKLISHSGRMQEV